MPRPKVSVVMAVYNFNRMPMRGIETMLSQSMEDLEFVLVDDGSNEETGNILKHYATQDRRIRLIRNDHRMRLASCLNRGIKLTKTNYIARADVNISYHRDRLGHQIDFMEKHPDIDILGSNFYLGVDKMEKSARRQIRLPEMHEQIIRKLSIYNCICHPSIMYKREKLIPFGPYKDGFGRAQDYHLWMRVRKRLKFHNLQKFLLTKWHRAKAWDELSRVECLKGSFQARVAGLSTSPYIWGDIAGFSMLFLLPINESWIHNLLKSLKKSKILT